MCVCVHVNVITERDLLSETKILYVHPIPGLLLNELTTLCFEFSLK